MVHKRNTVLLFEGEGCVNCRYVWAVLLSLRDEYAWRESNSVADSFELRRLDVEEHADLAQKWSVVSLPAVLIFQAGMDKPSANFVGYMGYTATWEQLDGMLEQYYGWG
ncbi:thioredoxin family protein [Calditrichota bacterium]